MSTATTVLKYALPFAAVLGLGVASAAFDPRLADAAPAPCSVDVLIHEDNSYSGLALRRNGVKVAHEWTVASPARQNTITLRRTPQGALLRVANVDWTGSGPVFLGQNCAVIPVRSG